MDWIALPWPPDDPGLPGLADAAGWWALRFTPRVTRVDEALLLEVSTTARLWGGREAVLAQIVQAQPAGSRPDAEPDPERAPAGEGPGGPVWATGPTALVALALLRLALAARPAPSRVPDGLPLHTLTALRPHVASLERMGCRTWGALRALPRPGVARRLGAPVLRALDQAYGEVPQAHRWLELPEQFTLTAELPALATSADALLWSASRCLAMLQGWLQARQQGALALELIWRHDLRRIDGVALPPTQTMRVRTAQPTQDVAHLRRLLAEHLARTPLAAPVNQITLRLSESAPLPHRSASLLAPGEEGGAAPGEALHQLLERLSARLGPDRVLAPVLQADHRPEGMQQWQAAAGRLGDAGGTGDLRPSGAGGPDDPAHLPDAALWPTWLLRPPRRLAVQGNRPCFHGLLRLLAGPHRFETGWWSLPDAAGSDAGEACPGLALRDYFVAHNPVAGLVWVFRERLPPPAGPDQPARPAPPARWFLQGVFG